MTPASRSRAVALHRRVVVVVLAALTLLTPAGCSLFVSPHQDVTLEASDPSARLFVDGREVGTGRAVVPLKRNDEYGVRAETADGRVARARIRKGVSTTGIIDVVGGVFFLIPFVGILGPGFWSLDPDYLFLELSPLPATGPATRPAGADPAP